MGVPVAETATVCNGNGDGGVVAGGKELYEGIRWSFLYLLPSLVVVVVKMEFI